MAGILRACDTVALLTHVAKQLIVSDPWPSNSPADLDLNPVDYKVWGVMQERIQATACRYSTLLTAAPEAN